MKKSYSEITPYIRRMAELSGKNNHIQPEMYQKYNVKRGLRDVDGNGVVTGLTEISRIESKKTLPDGSVVPCEGRLFYRGVDIKDFTRGFMQEQRFGFEEAIYLLLFADLPTSAQLTEFEKQMEGYCSLPPSFVRDMILKAPSKDMMNVLSPLLAVYGYHAYRHYHLGRTLYIRNPKPELSTAENILRLLRKSGEYTRLEAKLLDLALVLHAEHGGGNNSTFTTHVVTSSGTDTYSAVSAALGSLKGPRHGGANVKVVGMFDDLKHSVNIRDEGQIRDYLCRLLDRQAFDRAGLIYGMGHAVYSISDPRADILKQCAKALCEEKGRTDEYELYETVARIAPEVIAEKRRIYKGVSANVDFYSGLIYRMLDIPCELFTPFFAIARIAGWSAHRIEELQNAGKIIRPAYINVKPEVPYRPLAER